jgi:hypothetical protein
MALPQGLRDNLLPSEGFLIMIRTEKLDFIATEGVAKFKNVDDTMTAVYPNQVNNLPIWLIMELKKRKMGKIIMPDWLSLPRLKENLAYKKTLGELSDLPL